MKNITLTIVLLYFGFYILQAQDSKPISNYKLNNNKAENNVLSNWSQNFFGMKASRPYFYLTDTTWVVGNRLGVGTPTPITNLHVKGDGSIFTLEGRTHSFMQFYPDGIDAGRKAWIGFGSATSQDLTFTNQGTTGKLLFKTKGITRAIVTAEGNFGIRDANPLQPLSVTGVIRSSYSASEGEYLEIGHGGGNAYMNWKGDGNVDFRYNGVTKMRLSQNSFLGIGTDTPLARLHINTSTLTSDDYAVRIGAKGILAVDKTGILGGRLYISESGLVGLGTNEPTERLHVNGRARLSSNTNGTGMWFGSKIAGDWFIGLTAGDDLRFHNGSTRATMKPNGLFGLGTADPQQRLHVNGIVRVGMANHVELGHGGTHAFIKNGGVGDIEFRMGSETKVKITSDGKLLVGNVTAPSGYSIYAENGILTPEVKVALQSTADWSDDAFSRTPTLHEMEKSIKEHSHLYGMPSAKELVKTGYSVTEMDANLLEQIEWQAVNLIDLEKENKKLKSDVELLRKEMNEIKKLLLNKNE